MNAKLSEFWKKASPEQAALAPGLIAQYTEYALRKTGRLNRKYIQSDVEPCVMYALYKAAYSFKPAKSSFLHWLHLKIMGEARGLQWQIQRQKKHGITFRPLDVEELERRVV